MKLQTCCKQSSKTQRKRHKKIGFCLSSTRQEERTTPEMTLLAQQEDEAAEQAPA